MTKKHGMRHYEDEKLRMTEVTGDKAKELEHSFKQEREYAEKVGLVFPQPDGGEWVLMGFTTLVDPAGDPVFHYKIADGKQMFLYLKTKHPDSEKVGNDVILHAKMFLRLPVQDALDFMKEMIETTKKGMAGVLPMKEGRHPNMDYLDKKEEKKQ